MEIWREMEQEGMEKLVFCHDSSSGLQAIIAIHNTTLGPALGGCRYWAYTSKEEAIRDAIKLAKGMTYKNAMAGLPYGGGKAVVWDVTGASEQMTTGERVGGGVVDSLQSDIFDSLLIDSNISDMLGGTLIESIKGDTLGKGLENSSKDNVLGKILENSGMDEAGKANNGIIAENSKDETQTQDKVWMDTPKDGSFSGTQAESSVDGTFGEGLADPAKNKEIRASQFRALGRFLERLQGRFVTGLDLGTTAADMDQIRVETAYVTDTTGSLGAQDDFTADMTAYGVYIGIVTSLRHQGVADLQGIPVAVQGLGKVGYALCRYLHAAGARLIVADVVPERVQRALVQFSGAISADPARIHAADCKVFAPCALGGVITPATVEELRCSIVAGAANNQLSERQLVAGRMQARGILYAPDYVLSAGGIISTACELQGAGPDLIRQKVAGIAGTLSKVFAEAARSVISTADAADRLAEAILESGQND
ncbi:amino acid dehydrogenase [Paenibacillus cucumis Kampfer et al. 2016]|uniref:Amino acid dehydrogenase n=2 Tax=Paenibacillus cucumis (ex Kampfer et al. 2016) TaxID=1776858 RepID=A0ABS7KDB2_9BACL|nr:amino acid dehydrogenase [Paenibacillus cucumis (ex Kampfer et al. 2016)]